MSGNILFVSHRLPYPPCDGARIRAFHMLRHLVTRGRVTVASLARSADDCKDAEVLGRYCERQIIEPITSIAANARMIGCLGGRTPSSMGYFYSPTLHRRIQRDLEVTPYDLIVVYSSSVAPYVENVHTSAKLLDFVDMDSQKWLSYSRVRRFPLSVGYQLEGIKLQCAETRLSAKFDLCTCISRGELASLRAYGRARINGWFPNGVDLDYFKPADDRPAADNGSTLCFVGRMDYYPNVQAMVDFCNSTLPVVRRRRPDVRLMIVGADPVAAVRRLARIPGVEVTGTVPDVRPYLSQATISIAPLKIARGMQNKILEAMAAGIPVVASQFAADAIDADPGRHLLVASDPRSFAEAILELLNHPERRAAVATAARRHMEERYSWEHAMQKFDGFVDVCLQSYRTSSRCTAALADCSTNVGRHHG